VLKVKINGIEVLTESGYTVLQVCEQAGVEIPRFCYHSKLKIAGNCRMCLVEIKGGPPKPVASCAMPIADNMVIETNSEMVKNAREGVMEFMLINHPLDCPICDQGGECDLQDQSMAFGSGASRYDFEKRAIEKKNFGPLISTVMTRCIHCTRCVRFLDDVAGFNELGMINRGENSQIDLYVSSSIKSELSGNIIDLCPVGALTSAPYQFKARSWELKSCHTIDIMDAVGSAIRVDYVGDEVMRILPNINEDVNEEWISDKTRFCYDGLKLKRIDSPYIRKNGRLIKASYTEAFEYIKNRLNEKNNKIGGIVGDLIDCESAFALKIFLNNLGSNAIDCRQDNAGFIPDLGSNSYIFGSTIAGIEEMDTCLLICTNPRKEAAIINARLRKRFLEGNFKISYIGPDFGDDFPFNYKVNILSNDPSILSDILNAQHEYNDILSQNGKHALIIGHDALLHENAEDILKTCLSIADKFMNKNDWNGFNIIHNAASRVGCLSMDMICDTHPAYDKNIDILYLLGADELDFEKIKQQGKFIIYQGHNGDNATDYADVILPVASYTEKDGIYLNTEGRVQYAYKVVNPPANAKPDWEIIYNLASNLGNPLGFNKEAVYMRDYLLEFYPQFKDNDNIISHRNENNAMNINKISETPFQMNKRNFYLTNPICRSSKTMTKCAVELSNNNND